MGDVRQWSVDEVVGLLELPFNDLLYRAHGVHRKHFDANEVQLSTLLSIKTGGCPEDCKYCPQSARYATGVQNEPLLELGNVIEAATLAKAQGATRFCMGAAWRGPKAKDLAKVAEMIAAVKALGLETCVTLGMLKDGQAEELKAAGLDYYNHNIDTSPAYYGEIISTRKFDDRLDTLRRVRKAGIRVCCGGIVGMGETRRDRAAMLAELTSLTPHPESVPINQLVQVPGTPFDGRPALEPLEFVRTVAAARIALPTSMIRLSAGRRELGEAVQALCFFAGANSIFYGERLLTTDNPEQESDKRLLQELGLRELQSVSPPG
ncbi:MAG TPA: biotin synthase BioB [Burkholderiales bacterium]|nr:biotin synthase BioB [Burkholderiales bacterium]